MNEFEIDELSIDELRYVVKQFKEWSNGEECPKKLYRDFPCRGEREWLICLDENLKTGDLDEETRKRYIDGGFVNKNN